MSNLNLYQKQLEEEQKMKPKLWGKEIIKIEKK